MGTTFNQRFGARLRTLRRDAELTQPELAHAAQTDPSQISRWENGHSFPNSLSRQLLAQALGVLEDRLFIDP